MPHLDLNGFQRYAGQQKAWSQARFAPIEDANWQWTDKKGAVAFWPIGRQEIEPIVNFKFTEIPPTEGTKSLDNPSTIQGVSSVKVTRTGANLLEVYDYYESDYQWTCLGNGSYHFEKYFTDGNNIRNSSGSSRGHWNLMDMKLPKGRYKLRWLENNIETALMLAIKTNGIASFPGVKKGSETIFEIAEGTEEANVYFQWDKGIVYDEIGTPVLTLEEVYETEHGTTDSITVPLNDTYYGGSLNLRTGELTIDWIRIQPTINAADPGINEYGLVFLRIWPEYWGGRYLIPDYGNTCDKLPLIANDSEERFWISSINSANGMRCVAIKILASRLNLSSAVDPSNPTANEVLSAARTYVQSNPITYVCKLETPYTIQLNPVQVLSLLQKDKYTPRLNTFYSDQESVQVGYRKSPIRNELEQVQSILDLGGV